MGLSLLVHGGVVSAVYALRHEATATQVRFNHERALEMEIVSEPVPEVASRPTPPVIRTAEIPKTLPPTALPLPTIKPSALVNAETLPTTFQQPVESIPSTPAPVEQPETRIAVPPVQMPSVSLPAKKMDAGVPANYLINPKPAYPLEARRRREEGLVVLSVQVDRDGFPSRIQVVQSSKFERLDAAAVEAVSQWRFTPARIGSLAVSSQIEVPIRFRLAGS